MSKSIVRVLAIVSLAAGSAVIPADAWAGPCDPVDKYTKEVWGNLNQVADEACKEGSGCKNAQARVGKLYEQADKVVKWWNTMTKGTWAQLGPRNFEYGATNNGTLVAPGDRTWIGTLPTKNASVTVTLKKTDGGGNATAYICVAGSDGKAELKDQFDISDNGTVRKLVTGVEGKVVSVRLDGKGGAGKKVAYELVVR